VISARFNGPIGQCFQYGAPRFIDMSAIIETTSVHQCAHFRKEMAQFLLLNINYPPFLDAWRIDDVTTVWEGNHFGKGSCVLAFIRPIGYFARTQSCLGNGTIDECRFSDTAMSRNQGCFMG